MEIVVSILIGLGALIVVFGVAVAIIGPLVGARRSRRSARVRAGGTSS